MISRVNKVIFKVKVSYTKSVDGTLVINVIDQLSRYVIVVCQKGFDVNWL